MDSKELCAWLRENSSGAYRPAADAADLIERLEAAATPSPVPAEPQLDGDELRRAVSVIGIVGQIDGHDVIRRTSVLDIIDRRLASRPAPVAEQKPVAMVDAGDDGMFAEILPDVSVTVGQMLYAAPVADKDAMTRLRRVLGLLDITDPFPTDDDKLHAVLFSLLGQIARMIEKRTAPAAPSAAQAAGVEKLHNAILSIPCELPEGEIFALDSRDLCVWKNGFKFALRAAAELVSTHFATTPSEGVAAPVEQSKKLDLGWWPTAGEVIESLNTLGWRAHGDAQHEGIRKYWTDLTSLLRRVASAPAQPSAEQVASEAAVRNAALIPLNDETRDILGRPCFTLIGIAQRLRQLGHKIETRAEDEQAVCIHWMLNLWQQHGERWAEEGEKLLRTATSGEKGADRG